MTLEEIRKRKKEMGYSNAQLSNLTDIPPGTLNKILSGATKHPHPETLQALEKVLQDTTYQYGYISAAPAILKEKEAAYAAGLQPAHEKGPGDYTIDDYYALPDDQRVELIDGVFYDMAAPSVEHQQIAGSVFFQIREYILRKKGSCVPMISPLDVKLDPDNKTMVQPDVVIVCDRSRIKERIVDGAPDFVMEVVSPSTASRDYIIKAEKYLNAGVREFWIIDPLKKRVMIYIFGEDPSPSIYPLSGKLPVSIYQGDLMIDLDEYKEFMNT